MAKTIQCVFYYTQLNYNLISSKKIYLFNIKYIYVLFCFTHMCIICLYMMWVPTCQWTYVEVREQSYFFTIVKRKAIFLFITTVYNRLVSLWPSRDSPVPIFHLTCQWHTDITDAHCSWPINAKDSVSGPHTCTVSFLPIEWLPPPNYSILYKHLCYLDKF